MLTQAKHASTSVSEQPSNGSLLIGKVVSINNRGNPLVAYNEITRASPIEALTTVPLDNTSIGQDVAISFAQNQGGTPIVMGIIRRILDDILSQHSDVAQPAGTTEELVPASAKPEIIVDGNKLELSAAEEITLRCGKSSITLTKNGKILIKGEHMLNRISGAYKIKSGSIQLN